MHSRSYTPVLILTTAAGCRLCLQAIRMDTCISTLTHGSRPGHPASHRQTRAVFLAYGPCSRFLLCTQALKQSTGLQRQQYESWRRTLLQCLANVEAVIDFGEDEGIAEEVAEQVLPRVHHLGQQLRQHLVSGELCLRILACCSCLPAAALPVSNARTLVESSVSVLSKVLGLRVQVKACPHN